ncbi:MAG: fumarate hydratase, class [Mycobacterium sp.]|jgi:fumarate hydratase class II|nr:fumC [Mycobacterium sp.]MDT5134179.1 fumarate hydratase, class [Mycobacterium sp.]
MRPIVINNFLHTARILGDASEKLQTFCIDGIELNKDQISQYVNRSLMLVTALSPVIGYDKASVIAHDADRTGRTLRESALDSGFLSAEEFDRFVNPAAMVGPF